MVSETNMCKPYGFRPPCIKARQNQGKVKHLSVVITEVYASIMSISYRLLQSLLLAAIAAVLTESMACNKMIPMSTAKNSTTAKTGMSNDIMEMGKYKVRTSKRTDSDLVKALISKLKGASDMQYRRKSFTAVLQPKDLKKVNNY